jgi:hypothetical protein
VTGDCPIAASDGHDFPRLIDERVPGVAAVVDDVVEGFEDAVWFLRPCGCDFWERQVTGLALPPSAGGAGERRNEVDNDREAKAIPGRRASVLPEVPMGSRLWASHYEDLALINLNYNVMPGDVAGD